MAALYTHIKQLIPASLKYRLWIIFKARQRKISWLTWFTDIRAYVTFRYRLIFLKNNLKPISICTGTFNRSNNYLNQFLASLQQIQHKELVELSVYDCASTDIPEFESEIKKLWPGKLSFSQESVPFSRSYVFNKAIAQSTAPIIFICDADISVPPNIVQLCNNYTGRKLVWYPIYFFLFKNRPVSVSCDNGDWAHYEAKGTFACYREAFFEVGRLDEKYTVWGDEDIDLWERFYKNGYTVIRQKQPGMFHHWHNTFNPKYKHLND